MNQEPELKPLRCSKKELSDRINYAYELMMADLAPHEIRKVLKEKYGVCIRTAERYYDVAYRFLEQKNEKSRKRKIAWYLARKSRLIRDIAPAEKKTAAGVKAINNVLDSMAKMEGLMVDKVDVTSKGDKISTSTTIIKTADGTVITF